ncbi:hypothetical protein [Catenulispora pinisilvae]|uniref:hypothetical protein n=1 Tax=Catenulispora pinisilvae TaxID=2705253 RepID=UPI0018928152|nr:hypothetical protein [Catenulispora pinisilvae]
MTDLTIRAWSLLTCSQRPRSLRQLARDLRTDDRGSVSTETVIIVAIVVVIAVGVGALFTSKIMGKAASIHF